jgi:hypothetical protein
MLRLEVARQVGVPQLELALSRFRHVGASRSADIACLYRPTTQHDPRGAGGLAWLTRWRRQWPPRCAASARSSDLSSADVLLALAASERLSASVRFRAVTGRPSRQLPRLGCATNGHSRNSEAPLTPRKPSEFPCTSVRASSASQRARLRKKLRPYNAAEPRKSDRFPGVP